MPGVLKINVPGPALVKIDDEILGYTINGVDYEPTPFVDDVYGDQNGGDKGPPIDVQFLGLIVGIRCEFSKYNDAIADKIRSFCRAADPTLVTQLDIGALYMQDGRALKVEVITPIKTYTFRYCLVRNATPANIGLRSSRFTAEFEAHQKLTDSPSGATARAF